MKNAPRQAARSIEVEGRLVMVDFGKRRPRIRIERRRGKPVYGELDPALAAHLTGQLLHMVRVQGVSQPRVSSDEPASLRVTRIETIEAPAAATATSASGPVPEDEFWSNRTLDEIEAAQGVVPIRSFKKMLGGWPKSELNDGFEKAVRKWRDEETRARRT